MTTSIHGKIRGRLRRIKEFFRHPPFLVSGRYRRFFRDVESSCQLSWDESNYDDQYWAARLRLLAHALDKGLHNGDSVQRNRGKQTYQWTLEAIDRIQGEAIRNDPSVVWCRERKRLYDQLQRTGVGLDGQSRRENGFGVETQTFADLMKIIKGRRSSRNYTEQPVPDKVLLKLVDAIQWAPCSCNRQTVRAFMTNDSELARQCHECCRGKSCFGNHIPGFVCFCVDVRPYTLPEEYGLLFVDGALGAQNFALAGHAAGLSPTFMAWGLQDEDQEVALRTLLRIPATHRIAVNCTIGYTNYVPETPSRAGRENAYRLVRGGR